MTRAAAIRGLYAIADTGYLAEPRLAEAVEAALRGGARVIQYRDKSADTDRRLRQAQELRAICTRYEAVFIVNDDVALARAAHADGVHLGRDDGSVRDARAALGPGTLIGVSCYNELARAEAAVRDSADYIAFGSFFPSPTKPNAVRADASLLQRAKEHFGVPRVAIGGITPENGASLIAAGADALAVISGVFQAADVEAAARRYAALFIK